MPPRKLLSTIWNRESRRLRVEQDSQDAHRLMEFYDWAVAESRLPILVDEDWYLDLPAASLRGKFDLVMKDRLSENFDIFFFTERVPVSQLDMFYARMDPKVRFLSMGWRMLTRLTERKVEVGSPPWRSKASRTVKYEPGQEFVTARLANTIMQNMHRGIFYPQLSTKCETCSVRPDCGYIDWR